MSDSSAKRIFISYKHNVEPDQSVVDRVVGALELQRHIVFIDKKILPGDEWGQWIQERITESDFLITFLTAQSVLSQMVQEEVQLARELAQSQGRPKVIPVRLAYDEELPYPLGEYLNHIQWAEWESEADTQRLITQLTQAVSGQSFASGQSQPKEASAQSGQPDAVPPPTPSAQPRSLDPTKLDSPEGTIDPQSAFYVVRSSDSVALDAIQRQGVTITIKGPRQMGKSSLLIRTLEKAVEKKKRAVFLDYQLIERDTLTDADRFYRRFCDWVTDELEMENRVDEFWNSPLGNSQRCTRYFSRYLLKEVLSWVMKWTNGHPYLTQRLCIPLSDQSHNSWAESDIDRVVADTFFGAMSEQDNNLQFVRDMLTKRALDINDVLTVYREIWRARKPVRDEEQSLTKSHLKLSGIVRRENGLLCLRNSIYKTVFDGRWVQEHLPSWIRDKMSWSIFITSPKTDSGKNDFSEQLIISRVSSRKALSLALAGIAVIIISATALFLTFNSTKRDVIAQAKSGRLVIPRGSSTYDLFLKVEGRLSESDVAEISSEVKPLLEQRGNELLGQLQTSNTLLEEELGDMIRIYSWLDKLSPQNYYQARRAYAEARVAFERKNFEDAQMNLDQAIKLDPNWAMPYNLIGRIYSNRREYVRAKMFYQKAIEVEGNWIAPHMNLCVSSIENLKNYSLGEEACRPVIKLDPDRAAGHYFLGRALEGQHRYCEALSEYRIALLKVENTSSPSFNVDRLSKAIEIMASRTFCGNK